MDRRRSSRRRQAKLGRDDGEVSSKVEPLTPAINQVNEPDDGNLVRRYLRTSIIVF